MCNRFLYKKELNRMKAEDFHCHFLILLTLYQSLGFELPVPNCFWSGAVLTACYFNRMPSFVLDGALCPVLA